MPQINLKMILVIVIEAHILPDFGCSPNQEHRVQMAGHQSCAWLSRGHEMNCFWVAVKEDSVTIVQKPHDLMHVHTMVT